jgi:AcrR family transcriptional regulator
MARTKAKSGAQKEGARERLLAVAARHFAAYGFEGASQRAIQREADVNTAAAHYYFGSKEALYREVVQSHLAGIQAERKRRMDAIPAGCAGRDRLMALVAAYVGPHIELALSEEGRPYGRILARVLIEPVNEANQVFGDLVVPLREHLIAELREVFPLASDDSIHSAVSMIVMLMADIPYDTTWIALTGEDQTSRTAASWVETVQRFACPGMESLCGVQGPGRLDIRR